MGKELQFRRGPESQLPNANLLEGEPGYSTDTKKLNIGSSVFPAESHIDTQINNFEKEFINTNKNAQLDVLETKAKQKMLLNSEEQAQFDFVENQVVQDGMLSNISAIQPGSYLFEPGCKSFLLSCNIVNMAKFIVRFALNDADNNIAFGTTTDKELILINSSTGSVILNTGMVTSPNFEIYVYLNNTEINFFYNNKMFKADAGYKFKNGLLFSAASDMESTLTNIKILQYDRLLTPQEIHHNLSVLNNSSSIKELRATDDNNKTSILNFASDEDHVEMATGRTLRDEYMGVLKTMGKEFVSADGNAIEVNNGIEARAISAEIKGQTVKNYINCTKNPYYNGTIFYDAGTGIGYDFASPIDTSKKYAIGFMVIDAKQENTNEKITEGSIQFRLNGFGNMSVTFKVGEFKFTPVFTGNTSDGNYIIPYQCKVKITNMMLIESTEIDKVKGFFTGITSTEAVISNNGQQYPIYEPTIQGKTKILDGKLVNLEPSDPSLPKLGSTSSVSDTINIAHRILTINTTEVISSDFVATGDVNPNLTNTYRLGIVWKGNMITGETAICDKLECYTYNTNIDEECIMVLKDNRYGYINLNKSRFSSQPTKEVFLAKLKEINPTIRFSLASSQAYTMQLTEEQLKAYDAHRKVISLGGVGDVADTLYIKEDGSGILSNNLIRRVLEPSIFGTIAIEVAPNQVNTTYFRMKGIADGLKSGTQITTISDKLDSYGSNFLWANDVEGISFSDDFRIRVSKAKLPTDDIQGLIDYLTQLNATIIYQAKTPIVTHIPKELIPTILTHYTNNTLEAGGVVRPSEFKITVPTSRLLEQLEEIKLLEEQNAALSSLATQL